MKTVGFQVKHDRYNSGIKIDYVSNLNRGYKGTVLDTGSSTLAMPFKPSQKIMNAILEILNRNTQQFGMHFSFIKDSSRNYDYILSINNRIAFEGNEYYNIMNRYQEYFPYITMIWKTDDNYDFEFKIPFTQYLLYKNGHICLDLFGDTQSVLVGSNVMVNKFMIYDITNMKLGITHFNCDTILNHINNIPPHNISHKNHSKPIYSKKWSKYKSRLIMTNDFSDINYLINDFVLIGTIILLCLTLIIYNKCYAKKLTLKQIIIICGLAVFCSLYVITKMLNVFNNFTNTLTEN